MKIGILTGGGDCPGLNPVIRGIVRKANNEGHEVIGLRHGWRGLMEKEILPLDLNSISGILHRGGTILGTSRTNPYKSEDGAEKVKNGFKELGLDALIAIGGEDTLGVATKLYKEGVNVIGVPKTIDNDLCSTDFTFGFDTAVNVATECIDRLHTTAESHDRVMVVEVMGRHAGWIAAYSGIAGGADYILIPEIPINLEEVYTSLKKRHKRGKNFSIVVVSEGAAFDESELCLQEKELDQFGHVRLGGIGNMLGQLIEEKTGFETRVTVLGHIQRGGTPS
ncbi:MAG: ATP-dependent 6-phosphofructokinase, partial [Candidatus Omnitrophica bacterium]|nr:ATP-dependent 6-phosphofructokinase [Candidatus Omnitrophota bacterium]